MAHKNTMKKMTVKRRRGNAAVRERERLQVFNDALEQLQSSMPLRLPRKKKLHKKQTVQLATKYIKFLWECLDGKQDWSNRYRFMWLSKEDEDVIEAIDAASTTDTQTASLTEQILKLNQNNHIEFQPQQSQQSITFCPRDISRNLSFHYQNQEQSTAECIESTYTENVGVGTMQDITEEHCEHPSKRPRLDMYEFRDDNVLHFVQDLEKLPEISLVDVELVFCSEKLSNNYKSQMTSSPISHQSDDSAYGTDLSNNKTP